MFPAVVYESPVLFTKLVSHWIPDYCVLIIYIYIYIYIYKYIYIYIYIYIYAERDEENSSKK